MTDRPIAPASRLEESLRPLLEAPAVLGGLLSADDGILMAAALRDGLDRESLAAAGARLGQLSQARLEGEQLDAAVLDGTRLRLVVCPVSLGYLTVLADPAGEIEPVLAAAREAKMTLERTIAGTAASPAALD
ncbi:MAG: hypothetical protein ACE149_12790 [Armatimonadota bacterium]